MPEFSIKFVWVSTDGETLHEFDPETGEGPVLEVTRDRVLIDASEATENGPSQGVVRAYFGGDKHWHFDGLLSTAERRKLDLWGNADERERWKKSSKETKP